MSMRNTVLAAAILAATATPAVGAETITKNVTVAPDATVEVSNVQGSVEVIAWDKKELQLVAELESEQGRARIRGDRAHGAHRGRPAARQVPQRRGRRHPDAPRPEGRAPHRRHRERGHQRQWRARRAEPAVGERRGRDAGFRCARDGHRGFRRDHDRRQWRQGRGHDRERQRLERRSAAFAAATRARS